MKLPIPVESIKKHVAIVGMTGSGKTSTGKLLVEQVVTEDNARVCILDTVKSDWWGLISSADGKKPGLPFHILGGPRGHVPLHSSAGKAIGELVASGALRHSIIDMQDFEPGGVQRFFVDFAPALLRNMRGVLYLVLEEAHELAPKERAGIGDENKAIHYAKKLATAGRSKGIRLVVMTQRTQALHNAVLGSCNTLIAHNFSAPADQEPVVKWLRSNLKKEQAQEIADSLSILVPGEGWICSSTARILERRQFPRIRTYDNSATPDDDEHRHEVKSAPIDQDKLRAIIGDAVKEAEANDPKLLKAEISRLRSELARKPAGSAAVDVAAARQEGREEGAREGYTAGLRAVQPIAERLGTLSAAVGETIGAFQQDLRRLAAAHAPLERRPPPSTKPPQAGNAKPQSRGETMLPAAQRKILNALAFLESIGLLPADRTQVSLFAGLAPTAGHTQNMYGGLRTAGLAEYPTPGRVALTEAGRALADAARAPQTAEEMQAILLAKVAAAQQKILKVLLETYPTPLDRRECSERAGLAPDAGHTQNMYGGLRSLGVIDYPQPGKVVALPVLFLEH